MRTSVGGPVVLAVELAGAGDHPAAWRTMEEVSSLFSVEDLVRSVELCEQAGVDLVTVDDQTPSGAVPGLHGACDATVVVAAAALRTTRLRLVATAITRGDPVELAARMLTLADLSGGRAGWRPRVDLDDADRERSARDPRAAAEIAERVFAEAQEFVRTVEALWSAWSPEDLPAPRSPCSPPHEADALVRGVATVGGRRPQMPRTAAGAPEIAVLAHFEEPYRLAAAHADTVFVTPAGPTELSDIVLRLRNLADHAGRDCPQVLVDIDVCLAEDRAAARRRRAALDKVWGGEWRSDAMSFDGSAEDLAALVDAFVAAGADGVRLRPTEREVDLPLLARAVPAVRGRHHAVQQ